LVRFILGLLASAGLAVAWMPNTPWPFAAAHAASHSSLPSGELRYALHVTLAPASFDPAETPAQLIPFAVLYALHDALVRPVPGARLGPALAGNAATRVEAFIYSKGTLAYGGYPDIDTLFERQARERHPGQRAALLHRIQQLTAERAISLPLMDYRHLVGVGPRVAEHALNTIPTSLFPALEDIQLKGK
jgi:hypothetical protein